MKLLQSKYSGWLIHLTVWAVVFGMPLFVTGSERHVMGGVDYLQFLIVPLSFAAVFYTNYFVLIERYLFSHKIGLFWLCNALLICTAMAIVHITFRYIVPPGAVPPPEPPSFMESVRFFISNATLYLLVVGACVAVRMTGSWYRAEAARKELEHAGTEAELQNLKNQLNPHFLFNTLNNIYSLIQIDTDRAQQVVYDLGRILRYVLYESSRPSVPIKLEMEFLKDYIELMRIRQPRYVKLDVSLPENPSSREVAPLLFISLVENAFKHGVSNDSPSFISIDVHETDDSLCCTIENSSFPKETKGRTGSGIGLKNLTRRLEMLYPERHVFEYGEKDKVYRAFLSIRLD